MNDGIDNRDYPELSRALNNTSSIKFSIEPKDKIHAVKIFAELIANLNESDYGDFMRKANLYICDLKDRVSSSGQFATGKIDAMVDYTQFCSSWEIEGTRKRLLIDAKILIELLAKDT